MGKNLDVCTLCDYNQCDTMGFTNIHYLNMSLHYTVHEIMVKVEKAMIVGLQDLNQKITNQKFLVSCDR